MQENQVEKTDHHDMEGIKAERRGEYEEALQHLDKLEKISVQQNDPQDSGYSTKPASRSTLSILSPAGSGITRK